MNKDNNFYDVVGIGNAIVDVMAKVGEGFLTERDLPKGGMTLVNAPDAGKIYAEIMPPKLCLSVKFPEVQRPIRLQP